DDEMAVGGGRGGRVALQRRHVAADLELAAERLRRPDLPTENRLAVGPGDQEIAGAPRRDVRIRDLRAVLTHANRLAGNPVLVDVPRIDAPQRSARVLAAPSDEELPRRIDADRGKSLRPRGGDVDLEVGAERRAVGCEPAREDAEAV